MNVLSRNWLLLAVLSFAQGQALLSPRVSFISFPAVASPVLYGIGEASLTNSIICFGECPTGYYPVKSGDSGKTWLPLYPFPAGSDQNIVSIAVDPSNPETVYVAAQMNRGGIWKSIDGGQTWTSRVAGLPAGNDRVEGLTVAVNNSQVLYAAVGAGLYKSTDGAATWVFHANLPGGRNSRIALLPTTPTEGYYVYRGGNVFRSTDDGKTWNGRSTIALADGTRDENAYPRCVAIDPSNTDIVYTCIGVDAPRGFRDIWGFWRSGDGGATWRNIYPTPQTDAASDVYVDPRGGSLVHLHVGYLGRNYARSIDKGLTFVDIPAFSPIGPDPRTPDTVYGFGPVFVSRDGGLTFSATNATFRPTFSRVTDPVTIQLEQGLTTTQTLPVITAERLGVSVTASVTGASWLTIPAQTATTQTGLKVNLSAAGLAQGTYDASITLTSSQTVAGGTIPVRLIVNAAVPPGPSYAATVVAGGGLGTQWPETGAAVTAQLTLLDQATVDPSGRIYVSGTRRVRRIESNGSLTAIAGTGEFTAVGANAVNGDGGPATAATFSASGIGGMAVDSQGRVYLSDTSANRLRVVENGIIRTEFGPTDTIPGSEGLLAPKGLRFAANGDLWVASFNGILRIPAGQKRMELFFPRPNQSGASLNDVAVAPDGTLYFTDQGRHVLYRVRPGGPATVIAGISGTAGFNGDGLAAQVQLNRPAGVDVDAQGNVWIADTGNSRVRVLGTDGYIRTVAGGGTTALSAGVGALDVGMSSVSDVVVDAQGNVLAASNSRLIRLTKDAGARPRALSGSFVNAGSNLGKLSPGVLFSFYGTNLASSTAVASGSPWPTTLGGATVRINGTAVPLFYASPTQINGQVPYDLVIGSTGRATVTVGGLSSGEVQFSVIAASPGILVFGDNRAVAVNPNGSVNTTETPAKPGDVMVAYFTGTGLLDNAVGTGLAAPSDSLSRPTLPVKIFVGDQECQVLFLGLAPGYIGLGQANFTLPDLPPGDYPLTIAIGSETSNGPVITIGPK